MTSTLLARPAAQIVADKFGHCGAGIVAATFLRSRLACTVRSSVSSLNWGKPCGDHQQRGWAKFAEHTHPSLAMSLDIRAAFRRRCVSAEYSTLVPGTANSDYARFRQILSNTKSSATRTSSRYRKRSPVDLAPCNPPWSDAERWLRHIRRNRRQPDADCLHLSDRLFQPLQRRSMSEVFGVGGCPTAQPRYGSSGRHFRRCRTISGDSLANLPAVHDVALVPSRFLIRKND